MVKKIFMILGSIVGLMVLYIGTFATLSEMAEVVVIRTPGLSR